MFSTLAFTDAVWHCRPGTKRETQAQRLSPWALRTAGEEAWHDQPAIIMEALQPMHWWLVVSSWESLRCSAGSSLSLGRATQCRSNGLDFTKRLAQSLTNSCSSGRDTLQPMPNFWGRGSEFKVAMVDPFLWGFAGSRPVSSSPIRAMHLLSYSHPIRSSFCNISVTHHWSWSPWTA